jgi:hypothetical protein
VGLDQVDLERADLNGLGTFQLQLPRRAGAARGRWFTDLKATNRRFWERPPGRRRAAR